MKAIFEPEVEGNSVVVWEGGVGHRVVYSTHEAAESAFDWLIKRAADFHVAKEDGGVAVIDCYGTQVSVYEFVRRYLAVCKSAGYKVLEETMTRPQSEYW